MNDKYMHQALDLARKGLGHTSPNPTVGCVIVKDGAIVGQGYHVKAGSDHAEIVALNQAGAHAKGATVYVTLEPCTHHGKTPPCVNALIAAGVAQVVYASNDPHLKTKSKDILEQAGIEVTPGIAKQDADKLNEHFLFSVANNRPFITLKLAMTLDGKISNTKKERLCITGPETKTYVHKLRATHDAIMVGRGTMESDDPQLTVRNVAGRNPRKIIVDSTCSCPPSNKAIGDSTIILTTANSSKEKRQLFESKGCTIVLCDQKQGKVDLTDAMKKLHGLSIQSILCEGGSELSASLLDANLVQKLVLCYAPKLLGDGISGLANTLPQTLNETTVKTLGSDIVVEGYCTQSS